MSHTPTMIYHTLVFMGVMVGVAFVAGVGNRTLFRRWGQRAPVLLVPWWEEACKLGVALLFPNTVLLFIHVVYGLLELSYNLWRNETDRLFFGLLGLCVHGLVGGLSQLAYRNSTLLWAYLVATAMHMALNFVVVRFILPTLGTAPAVQADEPQT